MKGFPAIAERFYWWIDTVALTIVSLLDRLAKPRIVKLVEDDNGEFVLQPGEASSGTDLLQDRVRFIDGRLDYALPTTLSVLQGSRVELVLRPDRFLFRSLELPSRAAEFLTGIVRTQIDRLTPWSPEDAAYGWSTPVEGGTDRIAITVASTALASIKLYAQTIADIGAHSTVVRTCPPEGNVVTDTIKVWEGGARTTINFGTIRYALVMLLAAVSLAVGATIAASAIIGPRLVAQHDELARQIATARATSGTGSAAAQITLERRKQEAPLTVLVLENLSQILPDHTHVTELRVDGNKLRLIGIARDPPSLIGLMEQSGHFSRATFYAPTTRSPSNTGARFHIDAVIQPLAVPRS